MNIYVDIETYEKVGEEYHAILDSRKFFRGVIVYDNGKSEVFKENITMWNRILEIAKKQWKGNNVLNIYAHNHPYDFYGYANWKSKHLKYLCNKPFIVEYYDEQRKIKFLDSMSIYKGSLKKLGELIQHPKGETPLKITEEQIPQMEEYMINDAIIVQKAINHVKQFLKKENINIKRIYTISQIAIAYMLKKLAEQSKITNIKIKNKKEIKENNFFNDIEMKTIWETKHKTEIHNAYKGGRVEVWKTGTITNVNSIDINSLYPHILSNMRFPNLKTEQKINEPIKTMGINFLEYIGVSKVMIKNKTNDIGLLQIRTPNNAYVGKKGQILIGTWTNAEIKKAITNGYELISCEYTIIWQDDNNPFKPIIQSLYDLKKNATNNIEKRFYKDILNRSIGKFGQKRGSQEIIIDNIEQMEKYLEKGYKMIKGLDYDVMFKKNTTTQNYKKYYCPIIPTLVNANARIMLYENLKKIPLKDLVYCDTDSIKFNGEHLKKFKIGTEIGEWKIENENDIMICYGSKTYLIGDEIKIAGYHKRNITKEDFSKGIVKNNKMVTINTTNNENEVGMQIEETRNLNLQEEELLKIKAMMKKQRIHIDSNLDNIDYFMKNIKLINI